MRPGEKLASSALGLAAPCEELAGREVRGDHGPILLTGGCDGLQGCRAEGEGRQECVRPQSRLLELLVPLSQEGGQTWPRHLRAYFLSMAQQAPCGSVQIDLATHWVG